MANNEAYWWYVRSRIFSKFQLVARLISILYLLSYLISYQTMSFAYVNKGGSFGEIYMGVGPNLEKVLLILLMVMIMLWDYFSARAQL